MKQFFHNPMAVLAAYYFVSAAISGMPAPDSGDNKGYRWLYSTLHVFAANFGNVATQWKNGGNPLGPVVAQTDAAKTASKYSV